MLPYRGRVCYYVQRPGSKKGWGFRCLLRKTYGRYRHRPGEGAKSKVRNQQYEFAIPHFFEEMANDDLISADIETAIANGKIRRRFTRDPRGTRYEIVGPATDGRQVAIVCRIKATGRLLFLTTYLAE